jgi:hypothetical protein
MTQSQTTAPSLLGLEEDGRDLFGLAAHKLNTPLSCNGASSSTPRRSSSSSPWC